MLIHLLDSLMKHFRNSILILSFLGILACSNSNKKSENVITGSEAQKTVQDKTKSGSVVEDSLNLHESIINTDFENENKRQIISLRAKDSLNLKLKVDSIAKGIAIEEEKIALSRKKILNLQEELKFYKAQKSKLNADDSMRDAVNRLNQNLETVQGHIENEEENISLGKTSISKLEKKLEDIKILQSPAPASENITIKKADPKLDQQNSGLINKQALEKELSNLKKLDERINAQILYYEHMLDSLRTIDKEVKQEQLRPVIVLEDKKINENIDQDAANQLQDLANKTIKEKKNLSAEQVKAAKDRNSADTSIQANRGFAKFIGIFFLIIIVLIGSLYFLGKSFQGKKENN